MNQNIQHLDQFLYNDNVKHLPILSFSLSDLHYNLIVVLFNDLFGIQTRGGIGCCGLLAEYIENSYKFVEMNDQNTVFAILNNKYNLFFNKEPSNIPTIKHVIGNSIASLFCRYLLFNQDMRFNDNSDYYVANYI